MSMSSHDAGRDEADRRDAGRDDADAPEGVPGKGPAELPPGQRDPGNEVPMPDGDTMPMPDGDTVPVPDTTSPTPAPTELPRTGGAFTGDAFTGDAREGDEIDADTRQNGGIGNALNMSAGALGGESSTEAALKRATGG